MNFQLNSLGHKVCINRIQIGENRTWARMLVDYILPTGMGLQKVGDTKIFNNTNYFNRAKIRIALNIIVCGPSKDPTASSGLLKPKRRAAFRLIDDFIQRFNYRYDDHVILL